jgi:hypothetical protein
VLRQALTHLSSEHREIIDLVYYHEKSVGEVAQILEVPPATVKTRMFYARRKLAGLVIAVPVGGLVVEDQMPSEWLDALQNRRASERQEASDGRSWPSLCMNCFISHHDT